MRVDPGWEADGRSVSAVERHDARDAHRVPRGAVRRSPRPPPEGGADYPVGAKRVLRDNGVWAGALKRDNVELVTEPIREITAGGVVTDDGVEHDVDVIIYGTGFQASKFLTPMKVVGRERRRPARAVGRRRPRVPRHHRAGLPEPVLPLRPEHQHRDQRQHHLLLGVRGALRARLHRAAPARPPSRARRPQGRARRVQRARRRREPQHGVGRMRR